MGEHKRLSIVMIALSESFWILDSLRHHYDLADEIIIVEGAVPQFIENGIANKSGLSSDTQALHVSMFMADEDEEEKVKHIQVGKVQNRNELRQRYLEHVTGDWVLVVDADEFYKKEDFGVIRSAIDGADDSGYEMCEFPFLEFADWEWGRVSYPMERLFKYSKNLTYPVEKDTGQSVFKNGVRLWDMPRFKVPVQCYHYNRIVESKDRLFKKIQYYLKRDYRNPVKAPEELEGFDKNVYQGNYEDEGYQKIPLSKQPIIIQNKANKLSKSHEQAND